MKALYEIVFVIMGAWNEFLGECRILDLEEQKESINADLCDDQDGNAHQFKCQFIYVSHPSCKCS